MRNTHSRNGENALLQYSLAKETDLSNPMDPT